MPNQSISKKNKFALFSKFFSTFYSVNHVEIFFAIFWRCEKFQQHPQYNPKLQKNILWDQLHNLQFSYTNVNFTQFLPTNEARKPHFHTMISYRVWKNKNYSHQTYFFCEINYFVTSLHSKTFVIEFFIALNKEAVKS